MSPTRGEAVSVFQPIFFTDETLRASTTDDTSNAADVSNDDQDCDTQDQTKASGSNTSKSGTSRLSKDANTPGASTRPRANDRMHYGANRKAVQVDWDSDDEIIWQMKQEGYKDGPISDRLIEENRTRYDAKSIATRYSRMKRIHAMNEELTLDDAFSDYHEEEDAILAAAKEEAEAEFQEDLAKTESRHWQNVASIMKSKMGRAKYTQNSTKERWRSLQDGSAIVPIEQDPDAVARTVRVTQERLARQEATARKREAEKNEREEKKRMKMEEEEHKESEREKRMLEREEKRADNLQKKQELQAQASERARLKQDAKENKANKAAELAVQQLQKNQAKDDEQARRKWERDQVKVARVRAAKEAELARLEAEAESKKKKIEELQENNERRELIRRCFRAAGIQAAAPVDGNRKAYGLITSANQEAASKV